jgi:histidine triad (HIT) family protein
MAGSSGCVFCSIVAGSTPAAVVFRDERFMAFLDIRPLFPGHTLLIPLDHHETLADLPTPMVGPLFERARTLQTVMEQAMGAQGAFVAVNNRVSQSVPHLHVHVVPRTKGDGLKGFFWPRTKYASDDEATEVAHRLAASYRQLSPPDLHS